MRKIFLLLLNILLITVFTQPKATTKDNSIENQTNLNNTNNDTDKPKKKEFNLTESLIEFFNSLKKININETNKTDTQAKRLEEENQKRIEDERKSREKLEKMRRHAEKVQKEKEEIRQKKMQLEKEREEFEKQIENISLSEYTNLYIEGRSGELLYHNITKPCNLKIIFFLTDTDKTIHLTFNGPNEKGGTFLLKSFRSKNFLYYEHNAINPGIYTFYLNNYHNKDPTEIIFSVIDDLKKTDKLGKKNIDKI